MQKYVTNFALWFLFVAAFVLLAGQPGWCGLSFPSNSILAGCTGVQGLVSPLGMVILPSGALMISDNFTGNLYLAGVPGGKCPLTPSTAGILAPGGQHIGGMALGLDGQVYGNAGNSFARISPTGQVTVLKAGCGGLGMTLDPVSGDMFVTVASGPSRGIRRVTGFYNTNTASCDAGGHLWSDLHLSILNYVDGLAWSCDGTYLLVADTGTQIFKIDRNANASVYVTHAVFLASGSQFPDGIAFGASGTPLAGYAFTNNNDGSITSIKLTSTPVVKQVATPATGTFVRGDLITVDGQGRLLATDEDNGKINVIYWSQGVGGGFTLAGSTLCASMNCGALAASTLQINEDAPCVSGQNANTIRALVQAACSSGCSGCEGLNLARSTLITLLADLNYSCLAGLNSSVNTLYHTCPCDPDNPFCVSEPCTLDGCSSNVTTLFGASELVDPVMRSFAKRQSSAAH